MPDPFTDLHLDLRLLHGVMNRDPALASSIAAESRILEGAAMLDALLHDESLSPASYRAWRARFEGAVVGASAPWVGGPSYACASLVFTGCRSAATITGGRLVLGDTVLSDRVARSRPDGTLVEVRHALRAVTLWTALRADIGLAS